MLFKKSKVKLPTKVELYESVYRTHWKKWKNQKDKDGDRATLVTFVKADIEAIAKDCSCDADLVFAQLYMDNYDVEKRDEKGTIVKNIFAYINPEGYSLRMSVLTRELAEMRHKRSLEKSLSVKQNVSVVVAFLTCFVLCASAYFSWMSIRANALASSASEDGTAVSAAAVADAADDLDDDREVEDDFGGVDRY